MPGPAADRAFLCPHCRSKDIRPSSPHDFIEIAVRKLTPLHLYKCRECDHRGWRFKSRPRESSASAGVAGSGRPPEPRDRARRREDRRRALTMLLIATALGAASGIYLHGCQQGAETTEASAQ